MPREPRSFIPGVTYHLISRLVDREWFIQTSKEREKYFRLLTRSLTESDWRVMAYAVMSNHMHFAAIAGEHLLDTWVRRVHAPFAGWLNRNHDRIGSVFVRGPKAFYVAPTEIASVVAYIHNNPVRAGVASAPSESSWTSHRAYLGLEERPPWLHVADGLHLSGFESCESFDAWVRNSHEQRASDPLFDLLERLTAYEVVDGEIVEALPDVSPRANPERLVELCARTIGIPREQLCSPRRGQPEIAARAMAVHVGRRLGLSGADVARALRLTPQAVSAIALRCAEPANVEQLVATLRAEEQFDQFAI